MKNLASVFERIITFDCTYVLFAHGSCVVVPAGSADPRRTAREILAGCADGASSARVIELTLLQGWIVTARHPDVLTYVSPADVGAAASSVTVAFYGAAALDADVQERRIVHVERARSSSAARSSSPDHRLH